MPVPCVSDADLRSWKSRFRRDRERHLPLTGRLEDQPKMTQRAARPRRRPCGPGAIVSDRLASIVSRARRARSLSWFF